MRRVLGLRPAPEFEEWLDKMGLMASDGAFSPARQPPAALSKRMSLLEAQ